MWFRDYLFGTEGRFARVHWWSALLFWAIAFAVLGKLLAPVLPAQIQDCATRQTPESTSTLCIASWRALIPMLGAIVLVSLSPMIKRLHDRDKKDSWAYVYLAITFGPIAILSLIGPSTLLASGLLWNLVTGANAVSLLLAVAMAVEFGFLRGTKGPNTYGPEPAHFSALRGV